MGVKLRGDVRLDSSYKKLIRPLTGGFSSHVQPRTLDTGFSASAADSGQSSLRMSTMNLSVSMYESSPACAAASRAASVRTSRLKREQILDQWPLEQKGPEVFVTTSADVSLNLC